VKDALERDEPTAEPRGVVLAGGQSTRFGPTNKALAPLDGRPLVAHVIEAVRPLSAAPPVVAVQTDAQAAAVRDGCDEPLAFVHDDPALGGPLAGLASAARVVSTDRCAVVACDMPLVTTTALRWLAGRSRTAAAVVPVDQTGTAQPTCAVYQTSVLDAAATARGSLRSLLADREVTRVPIRSAPAAVQLDRAVVNINTRSDLTRVQSRYFNDDGES